jgi:hypothetical protein
MQRSASAQFDATGAATVSWVPNNRAVEWDIYQISIRTNPYQTAVTAEVNHAGFFRCASPQGGLDTATGPPDVVQQANEEVTVYFTGGTPGTTAIVNWWYNENPTGTTISWAH